MTANVKILVDHRDNALKIPNAALRYRPAASAAAKTANTNRKTRGAAVSQTIWTLGADGKPQPVEAQLGISDGTWTEVRSGNLQEGESVILGASSQGAPSTSATASPFGGGASRRGPGF
jgi:HlyD family secretion protein